MRGVAFLFIVFALAACTAGGTTPPALSTGSAMHVYVGTAGAVYAYPVTANGSAPPPSRVITFDARGSATTVAADGTVYETTDRGTAVYPPGSASASRVLANVFNGVLTPDGIATATVSDTLQGLEQCDTADVATYPVTAASAPAPMRTAQLTYACVPRDQAGARGAMLWSDASGGLYVYHRYEVDAIPAGASGRIAAAPVASVPDASPAAFAMDASRTLYILAFASLDPRLARIDEYDAGNLSGAPSRTLGPFVSTAPTAGNPVAVAAMTVDAAGNVYLGVQSADRSWSVEVFAPHATDATAPLRTIANVVPAGASVVSLAIGP